MILKWRLLNSSSALRNRCYILFIVNRSMGDSLSFVSSLLNLSPNLVIEPWIMPRRRRLPEISPFLTSAIIKMRNESYFHGQ